MDEKHGSGNFATGIFGDDSDNWDINHMNKVMVAAIIGVLMLLTTQAVYAVDPVANPPMTLDEAHGFQHLITEGDMLILVRYELPKADWRVDAADVALQTSTAPFAAYMEEGSCIDNDEENLLDLCYTSLLSGVAINTFYNGPHLSSTLLRSRTLPRVGDGISGVYFGTGHSITFGDPTYEACIEGSATLFSPKTADCDNLLWHNVATSTAYPTIMEASRATNASALVSIALNLQQTIPGRQEALVVNDYITPTGAIFFKESYTNIVLSAPGAFAASEAILEDVELNTAETAAEATIRENRGLFYGYVDDYTKNHFGETVSTKLVGGVLVAMIAAFIFVMALLWVKSVLIATIVAAVFVFGFGVLNDIFDMALYLIMTLGLFTIGIFTWAKAKL